MLKNALLAATADLIGGGAKPFAPGLDLSLGRYGAVTIIDYRDSADGLHHAIAYLCEHEQQMTAPDAQALLAAWLAGDRQVWSEAQTADWLRLRRATDPDVAALVAALPGMTLTDIVTALSRSGTVPAAAIPAVSARLSTLAAQHRDNALACVAGAVGARHGRDIDQGDTDALTGMLMEIATAPPAEHPATPV